MGDAKQNRLIAITVDTEEEGLWGNQFRVEDNTTENLKGLERFQHVCESFEAPPTYLVDAPVVQNSSAMSSMRRWQRDSVCEVGAHCHAWCNPPLTNRSPKVADTFLNNYSREQQDEKLRWLTEAIADATGVRPTSYRSGRYGFDRTTAEILDDLGYRVDSSVLPLFDYSDEAGPSFLNADRTPSRYFGDDAGRRLIEVPVTSGFVRAGFDWQKKIWLSARKPAVRRFRLAGIADRVGIARRVKLTPEGTQLGDQKRLLDACVADGLNTLVLMLHSTSLVAGLSPYSKTPLDLESFYERFSETIDYALSRHGFRPVGLTQTACGVDGTAVNL